MEGQEDWNAHAFMNALESEGFVVLGGPLEGTRDVLLVIRAKTSDQIIDRLSADPWARRDLLRVSRVSPWTLRLALCRKDHRSEQTPTYRKLAIIENSSWIASR
ncbi:MAG: hypothetical protein WAR24_09050 [Candidatus Acidiferrales bacterium]